MAPLSHRHQPSLEGIIDFSEAAPSFENVQQRAQATDRFHRIVAHFENTKQQLASSRSCDGYNRPALIRLTFEYAHSLESQDKVASLRTLVFSFADHLIYYFFLPLRASTGKTPQPTPTYHIAGQQVQTQEEQQRMQEFVGTPKRLGALRGLCLTRDRHRCVITCAFDQDELAQRLRQSPARDDDGNVLNPRDGYSHLEVAQILPFGLTKVEGGGELSESKKATIAILNTFDVGVIHLIEGIDINAITLSLEMHKFSGTSRSSSSAYISPPFFLLAQLQFPLPRTLFSHASIDTRLERLPELHSAIGHVLHLSGAGDYIKVILRDMEDGVVREGWSTQLGALVNAALQIST
ncbi:hypothetical protein B0T26DRAFT_744173 [Lasiosphaeria miniovina]|uniref:HNH nuclease domain-containing protein n=1 Tax=Lasiosphaeria miniovina TaxID=1954250 RepID=A0AA39ZSY2_9PEZI|nr:uncharacterized protein B0T26DRAFT_744173 [Lasiosphaeria miniovina]KAK0703046.1 hypothetical protein B0T26DRAFT_744173 [Lasiosphaeria miniovina]